MDEKSNEKTNEKPNEKSSQAADKKAQQEEFLKTVESKLHKEEKHIWFYKDKDHLNG